MKITINGGHCLECDRGVVGKTGLQEAIVTKDIMVRVAEYLRAVAYDVLEVQENILHNIIEATNRFNSDAFVAIHCNFSNDEDIKGTESFYDMAGGNSEEFATCIQRQIVSSLGTDDRGVKIGNFYVLRLARCPAVLVELAFMSNREDEMLLEDKDMRDQFAAAIARGITDYFSL